MHIVAKNIYVGSLFALRGQQSLRDANVTHILSVFRGVIEPQSLVEGFTHLHIGVDDDDDEDILATFGKAVEFISSAVDDDGGVLVHWYVIL